MSASESERVDPGAIARLRAELGPLVQARGFTPLEPKSRWTGKFNLFVWERRSWKRDTLELGWRTGPATTRAYFFNASWSVPRAGAGKAGDEQEAAGMNPAHVRRGDPGVDYPEPLLRKEAAEKKWCAEVLEDARFAMDWLDGCETAEGALAELRRAERNGPSEGSKAYAYVEEYIRAHAPRHP